MDQTEIARPGEQLGPDRLEQRERAADVGVHEGGRSHDRPIDVGLRSHMDHGVGRRHGTGGLTRRNRLARRSLQQGGEGLHFADVRVKKEVATVTRRSMCRSDVGETLEITGVGEQIEIYDDDLRVLCEDPADEVRADETRSARDEQTAWSKLLHHRVINTTATVTRLPTTDATPPRIAGALFPRPVSRCGTKTSDPGMGLGSLSTNSVRRRVRVSPLA